MALSRHARSPQELLDRGDALGYLVDGAALSPSLHGLGETELVVRLRALVHVRDWGLQQCSGSFNDFQMYFHRSGLRARS
jgi:hypothetical protein